MLQNCYKKKLKRKNLLEVTKGIERLQQNALDKLSFFQIPTQSKSSDSLFLVKLKTIMTCFEQDIFTITRQVYS